MKIFNFFKSQKKIYSCNCNDTLYKVHIIKNSDTKKYDDEFLCLTHIKENSDKGYIVVIL